MKLMTSLFLVVLLGLIAAGCGGGRQVTRLEAEQVTDLSGKWNDTDSRLVAGTMIDDCLSRPWLQRFTQENGRPPVVTIGTIRNQTSEHINMETFLSAFEEELINSGQVTFVASKEARAEIRGERQEQQEFASRETAKKMREETGADFILQGAVASITDQEGKQSVVYYQTDLELINIESMVKAWTKVHEIKKGISQGSTKW